MNPENINLKIHTTELADVYLACTWRENLGQDAAWTVVKELDSKKIRVLGDIQGGFSSSSDRIKRIMSDSNGFLAIFPFRQSSPNLTTSNYIIQELELAIKNEMPIGIFFEYGVDIKTSNDLDNITISFNSKKDLVVKKSLFNFCEEINPSDSTLENKISIHLSDFIENVKIYSDQQINSRPFTFLTTRLKPDFKQIREAIKVGVENELGLPCIWSDDNRHHTSISGIRERTRLLIRDCNLFVAEITNSTELPDSTSPSRAHEIGMAVAYQKPIILAKQEPRNSPYFSAGDLDTIHWKDEKELYEQIILGLSKQKEKLGRRVFNFELQTRVPDYLSNVRKLEFKYFKKNRYISPNLYKLTTFEGWAVAIGFGLTIFSISYLIDKKLDYGDSLDLAPIIAGIVALIFSSDINKTIKYSLARYNWLKVFIPFLGICLLIITILLLKNNS